MTPIEILCLAYKQYGAGAITKDDLDSACADYKNESEDKEKAEKDIQWLLKSHPGIWSKYSSGINELAPKKAAKKALPLTPIETLCRAYKQYGAGIVTKANLDSACADYKKGSEDQEKAEKDIQWLKSSNPSIYSKYLNDAGAPVKKPKTPSGKQTAASNLPKGKTTETTTKTTTKKSKK